MTANLTRLEEERDRLVREFGCPVCPAAPGELCVYGVTSLGARKRQTTSHEGRYNLAADAGVVPQLGGRHA